MCAAIARLYSVGYSTSVDDAARRPVEPGHTSWMVAAQRYSSPHWDCITAGSVVKPEGGAVSTRSEEYWLGSLAGKSATLGGETPGLHASARVPRVGLPLDGSGLAPLMRKRLPTATLLPSLVIPKEPSNR